MGIYLLHFLKQYLTAFVDLFYRRGLEKITSHFVIFSMKCSSHIVSPPSGVKNWRNMVVTGVPHSCVLIELGPVFNSMADSL